MPTSLEAYYQHTGRAGRDGNPSKCILFFRPGDRVRIRKITQQKDAPQFLLKIKEQQLTDIVNYGNNGIRCRRVTLMEHFGESYKRVDSTDCCDNCTRRPTLLLKNKPKSE